jgi:EAL domain-containing protein (putative c-di-GMP-specific phosphodiesterase class I)
VLNMRVTAEGVETAEQALVLRELRCDLVQGYLFGRPMRPIDVAACIIKGVSGKWPSPLSTEAYRKGAA